ncbi:tetratricopeptide repeat protein, partial [bacterium]|nr:tetratricopeptide repeat protein [bacterium]
QAPGIIGGSDKEAAHQLAEIKKIDTAWGYIAEAVTHRSNEDNDAAVQAYQAAIAAQPDSLNFQYMLAYMYQELEKPDEAYELLEGLLERHPEETNALYQIGRTGAITGQGLDKARPALQQYLLIETDSNRPSHDWAHFRLGNVFEHEGAVDSARVHYEMTLQLNPDHKEAKKALKNLK